MKNNHDSLQAGLGSVQGLNPKVLDWQKSLVAAIHFLHGKGWAPATSSNYSIRPEAADEFWISASGIDKGEFRQSDLMRVDMHGKPIQDSRKSSAETLIHCVIYDLFPEARCVLHTHSIYNTVLSMAHAQEKLLRLEGFEVLKGLSGITTHEVSLEVPVLPNSQDMVEFSSWVRALHAQSGNAMKGFLIQGHGLYTWGIDVAETKRQVEVFEFLFEVVYKLKAYSS